MAIVFLGSGFGSYVFLTSSSTDSRYYSFGLTVMLLAFLVSSTYLVFDRRK